MALYPSIEAIELTDDELQAVAGGNPFSYNYNSLNYNNNSFNNSGNVSFTNSGNVTNSTNGTAILVG